MLARAVFGEPSAAKGKCCGAALTMEPDESRAGLVQVRDRPRLPERVDSQADRRYAEAEPSQAIVCEDASWTVTRRAVMSKAARSAPGIEGVVAVRMPWRSVRCQAE